MTKQKHNQAVKKPTVNKYHRLVILIAAACSGTISFYFSIRSIGEIFSLVPYIMLCCCLAAPFITTRRIGKPYVVISILVAVMLLLAPIALIWGYLQQFAGITCSPPTYATLLDPCIQYAQSTAWQLSSSLIPPLCALYVLATIIQAAYHNMSDALSSKPHTLGISNMLKKNIPWLPLGWSAIMLWIPLYLVLIRNGVVDNLLPHNSTEESNFIATTILLTPIAIASFFLVYWMDFRAFTVSSKPLKTGPWIRAIRALLITIALLYLSWWWFYYLAIMTWALGMFR